MRHIAVNLDVVFKKEFSAELVFSVTYASQDA